MNKKLFFSIFGGLLVLTLAAPTLAASSDFFPLAQKAFDKYCEKNKTPLTQALGCYAFEKLSELETNLANQSDINANQSNQITAINSSVAGLESTTSTHTFQISDLESTDTDLQSQIDELTNQVSDLENQDVSGFPAPDFDSGWIELPAKGNVIDVLHHLGGGVEDYFVDVSWRREAGDILSHQTAADSVWWEDLTPEGIQLVTNGDQSNLFIAARVRIWRSSSVAGAPYYRLRVPVDGSTKTLKVPLPGEYRIVAENTFNWGSSPSSQTIADPEWIYFPAEFTGWREAWDTEGFSLENDNLDLQVDGQFVNWAGKQDNGTFIEHTFSPSHQYQTTKYISDQINFKLYDTDYHDNSGVIEVVLYKL